MEDVKSLILKFSKPELKYLKTLLNAFHGKSNENKMLELVELIEKKPEIQQSEASKKLYGDPKTKAFLVMKARLMERLYEVVLASPKIPNNPLVEEDENAYAYIQLQKDFTLAIALRRRGLSNLSKEILQQCLKNPHTHLNPSFKVMLLEYFRTSVDNFADLEQINKDLEYAIPQQKLCIEAANSRDELRLAVLFESFSRSKYIEILSESIAYLAEFISKEEYYTPKLHFYFLSNKIELYKMNKDEENSYTVINEMVKLFDVHPQLAINNRKGLMYFRLAEIDLSLRHYKNTIKNSNIALQFFSDRPRNYWAAACLNAFSNFYLGEWEKCMQICNDFSVNGKEKIAYLEDLFFYLKLCIQYLNGNIRAILQQIHLLSNAYSNKEMFNTNIRIFEIMILIETEDVYFAELKIDALRKHLERYTVLTRDLVCYKILNQLQLKSFDFQVENAKVDSLLDELRDNYKWHPSSFEAIRFETWFEAQKQKVSYWEIFQKEEENYAKKT